MADERDLSPNERFHGRDRARENEDSTGRQFDDRGGRQHDRTDRHYGGAGTGRPRFVGSGSGFGQDAYGSNYGPDPRFHPNRDYRPRPAGRFDLDHADRPGGSRGHHMGLGSYPQDYTDTGYGVGNDRVPDYPDDELGENRYAPQAGPHRGRGPRGYKRSDARIMEDVCDRLTEDPMIDASDIEVTVQEGEVTLTGTVADRSEKRRAEEIADFILGVVNVQNNLRMGPSR